MKYNTNNIIINKTPELYQLPNEKWKQVWSIVLKKPICQTIDLLNISKKLSHEDFNFSVQIQLIKNAHLKVNTIFDRDSNLYHHDHSLFTAYRMFEEIEKLLGAIDTIEGQKIEDRWSPYRKKRKIEND